MFVCVFGTLVRSLGVLGKWKGGCPDVCVCVCVCVRERKRERERGKRGECVQVCGVIGR